MNKKAQGISLNVIIIAALALIVLLVVVLIFTGRIQIFGSTLASCDSKGGVCEKTVAGGCFEVKDGVYKLKTPVLAGCKCEDGRAMVKGTDCEKQQLVCCIQLT